MKKIPLSLLLLLIPNLVLANEISIRDGIHDSPEFIHPISWREVDVIYGDDLKVILVYAFVVDKAIG